MNAQEKYEYWLDIAKYDLETADAMLATGRWLYVIFMSQQAIEKLVKGLYTLYVSDEVPRTHNINFLLQKFEDQITEPITEGKYELFEKLRSFYIAGRYADFKQKLSESIDEQEAKNVMKATKEAFAWLLTLKP